MENKRRSIFIIFSKLADYCAHLVLLSKISELYSCLNLIERKSVNIINQKDIRRILIDWYQENMRSLPLRETNDSYKIWVSEVILQQTRVAQGLNYYLNFIEKFPTVHVLAESSEKEVLKAWQGLGYYSRARNLHTGAKSVVALYKGKLPDTHKEILTIKGIGTYTAAAVLSIAYNKPYAVVDGNVYRVLSRLFAIDTPIDTTVGKKQFAKLADSLLDENRPGMHNQAVMELGALCCTPSQPLCNTCPLQRLCEAKYLNMQSEFPVKSKKVKVTKRFLHYFYIKYEGHTYLNKRKGNDIWKNMYEFPLIETSKDTDLADLMDTDLFKTMFNETQIVIHSVSNKIKHMLTHQHLFAKFYVVEVLKSDAFLTKSYLKINETDISLYPISRLIHRYLEEK